MVTLKMALAHPIDTLRLKLRALTWQWQWARTPVQIMGPMLVKDFKGSIYCVGMVTDITIKGKSE